MSKENLPQHKNEHLKLRARGIALPRKTLLTANSTNQLTATGKFLKLTCVRRGGNSVKGHAPKLPSVDFPVRSAKSKVSRRSCLLGLKSGHSARKPASHNRDSRSNGDLDTKHTVYSQLFSTIIEKDTRNGKALSEVKEFFEEYIAHLQAKATSVASYKKQIEHLSRENFQLSKQLERLQGTIHCEEQLTTAKRKTSQSVPKLNLQSFYSQGFHDEFLTRVHEFSVSWREALRGGR